MIGNIRSYSQLEDAVAVALIDMRSFTKLAQKPNCSKLCLHTKHDANCVNFTSRQTARPSCAFFAQMLLKRCAFCVQGNRSCSAVLLIELNHRTEARGEEPVANFFRLDLKPQPNVHFSSEKLYFKLRFENLCFKKNTCVNKPWINFCLIEKKTTRLQVLNFAGKHDLLCHETLPDMFFKFHPHGPRIKVN
jgi:hypothetical protein